MTPPAGSSFRAHLLLYAGAAAWLALSGIHAGHNSDSFVFGLLSLDAYAPFFWEQDRVGMLVPLAAAAVRDPLWNLVLQTGLSAFAGLCVPLLLAELVYPHANGRLAAVLANAVVLGLAPERVRANLLFECCYPQAMALGCAALLVLGRGPGWPSLWRALASAALMCLACWVYLGVPLWLGPLALARGWLEPDPAGAPPGRWLTRPLRRPRVLIGCALVVVGFAVGFAAMLAARSALAGLIEPTPQGGLPPSEWLESWGLFLRHFARFPETGPWLAVLFGGAAAGVLAARLARVRPEVPLVPALLVLLVPAVAEFGYIGTRTWTAMNDHHPRYLLGTAVCLQLACALLAVRALSARAASATWPHAVAALVLFAAATAQFGFPTPDRPRREIEAIAGQWTDALTDARADAVGGVYWTTWPAAYHMNLTRRRAGDGRVFPAITIRGAMLLRRSELWDGRTFRVAVWNAPDHRNAFLYAASNLGLAAPVKIGESGPFELYETRAGR
jgi:hypothetical protein